MDAKNFLTRAVNFFREDVSGAVGAYFDGGKIFVVHLSENFEAVEVDADGSEPELIAEKISLVCRRQAWQTSAVGFCLREGDAVTYQTELANLPEKEIPAFVKSWSTAQAGTDAVSAFIKVGDELWTETLPQQKSDEFCAAWKKFGMNLRALSVMPVNMLTKDTPLNRAEFIARVVRNEKAPNLLSARNSAWSRKKISLAAVAILLAIMFVGSAKIFFDYRTASAQLDAAKISLDELRTELEFKEAVDADIVELHRLNRLSVAQAVDSTKFNRLINLGKVAGGGVRLTKIRGDENFLELEGVAITSDAVKSYLGRVKNFVVQSARLESSTENDDGDIVFAIRATF